MNPPPRIYGEAFIPSAGPFLVTINHYTRPGFYAWWLALVVSAALPMEVHWIVTAAWTYKDPLRSHLVTPLTRWAFRRVAGVYGFTAMPPMPPDPREVRERAWAVRRILAYARSLDTAVLGLAPEGRDTKDGKLCMPPQGLGRFVQHLVDLGMSILPAGVYEQGDHFCVRFGPVYTPGATPGLSPESRDRAISQLVMERIACQLPKELRGEYCCGVPNGAETAEP
jgi:hypothetical protein